MYSHRLIVAIGSLLSASLWYDLNSLAMLNSTLGWPPSAPHDFPHPTHWMALCTMTPTSTQRCGERLLSASDHHCFRCILNQRSIGCPVGSSVAELAFWLSQGLPERSRLWVTLCWHCCVLAQDSPMFTWDSYHFWIGPLLLPTHGPRATFWRTLTILGNSYTLK